MALKLWQGVTKINVAVDELPQFPCCTLGHPAVGPHHMATIRIGVERHVPQYPTVTNSSIFYFVLSNSFYLSFLFLNLNGDHAKPCYLNFKTYIDIIRRQLDYSSFLQLFFTNLVWRKLSQLVEMLGMAYHREDLLWRWRSLLQWTKLFHHLV